MKDRGSIVLVLLLLELSVQLPLCAQDDSTSLTSIIRSDAGTVWKNTGAYFTAPLHFSAGEWIAVGTAIAGTALVSRLDQSARAFQHDRHSQTADEIAGMGRAYGHTPVAVALSGGLYLGGLVSGNGNIRSTGLMVFEAIALGGITTTVLKSVAGRSRPFLEEGAYAFHGPQSANEMLSFPSGHSTVAFAVSSVLAGRVKNTYATIAFYSLAAITALSRVYNDEHWLSDNVFGAAIGAVSGLAVVRMHEGSSGNTSFHFIPLPGGVRVELRF